MSYEEEDTCMSYEEEDTCKSYEEEDTCMSYEEERLRDRPAVPRVISSACLRRSSRSCLSHARRSSKALRAAFSKAQFSKVSALSTYTM